MRVACLVSGGKDSILAAATVRQWGWTLDSFVTLLPEAEAPMLYHRPNVQWVRLQAETAGLPWHTATVGPREEEREPLRRLLARLRVDGLVTGALASEYQRTRFESLCHEAGLRTFSPLWHHGPAQHLRDVTGMGVRSIFVHVAAEGLAREWLGRELDLGAANELEALAAKHRLNAAGEGGEYETFVVDAPFFQKRIEVTEATTQWKRDMGTYVIHAARLTNRQPA